MNHEGKQPVDSPKAEQLAAYVDGELSAEERCKVGTWLVTHPEAMAEVRTLRRLAELMQASAAPEPDMESWDAARLRIDAALARSEHRPIRGLRWALGLSAAAAAALVLVLARDHEPFPVAAPHDVAILSMDPNDAPALVVGQPPVLEPIVLARHDEVTLLNAEPTADGRRVQVLEQGAGPMLALSSFADER